MSHFIGFRPKKKNVMVVVCYYLRCFDSDTSIGNGSHAARSLIGEYTNLCTDPIPRVLVSPG